MDQELTPLPVIDRARRRAPRSTVRALALVIAVVLLGDGAAIATHDEGDRGVEATAPSGLAPVTLPTSRLAPPPSITVPTVTVPPVTVPEVTIPPVTVPPVPRVSLLGKILFHSNRGSAPPQPTTGPVTPSGVGYNVWVVNPDGTGARPLTTGGRDGQPDLSPDGTKVAWVSGGDNEIWTMNANGTERRRVATCELSCGTPRWSPTADRIAFASFVPGIGGADDVFVVRADGSAPRRYVTPVAEYGVTWSPDGTRLAVSANEAATRGLYLLEVASGSETKIVDQQVGSPDWSPDGSKILWSDDHSRLVTVNPDGGDLRLLTPFDHQRFDGQWSRDGSMITYTYFAGVQGLQAQLATMRADGTGERLLTDGLHDDADPTF